MTRSKSLRLAFLAMVAVIWTGPCRAAADLPATPPASHVLDNAGLYARDPEGLQRISDRLRDLETHHGYHIHVIVESVMLDTSSANLAARLQPLWIPKGDGLIIVYETDNRTFGISPSDETGVSGGGSNAAHIPSYVAAEMFGRIRSELGATQKGKTAAQPAELLDRMTGLLARECDDYFNRNAKAMEDPVARRLLVGFLVAIPLLALLGWMAMRKLGRVDERNSRTFYFPEVPDGQRLGAPFGATVSVRRFSGQPGESV